MVVMMTLGVTGDRCRIDRSGGRNDSGEALSEFPPHVPADPSQQRVLRGPRAVSSDGSGAISTGDRAIVRARGDSVGPVTSPRVAPWPLEVDGQLAEVAWVAGQLVLPFTRRLPADFQASVGEAPALSRLGTRHLPRLATGQQFLGTLRSVGAGGGRIGDTRRLATQRRSGLHVARLPVSPRASACTGAWVAGACVPRARVSGAWVSG
jgi:hypothetical protein